MWKSRDPSLLTAIFLLASSSVVSGQDVTGDQAAGEQVFGSCRACHAIGENATNRLGPQLNDLFGRVAGGLSDYNYSPALVEAGEGGLVWDAGSLADYIGDPRSAVPGTKMAFAGIRGETQLNDLLAYLAAFSGGEAEPTDDAAEADGEPAVDAPADNVEMAEGAPDRDMEGDMAAAAEIGTHGVFGIGRPATRAEVEAWDIDIRPDGEGLPIGSGSVMDGEPLYIEQCAFCHGDFGEGMGRWPALSGGEGTLEDDRPEKTVGSFWPYTSTLYDYIKRAMPFGNARSLSDDEVYALTAYVLSLNYIVDDDFVLSNENFSEIRMPNEENFVADGRYDEPHYAERQEPCMRDCLEGEAEITMRAMVLDVTPEDESETGSGIAID